MRTQLLIYTVLFAVYTVYVQGKLYLSTASDICAGYEYEMGCGPGLASLAVMKMDRILLFLESETHAFNCQLSGSCHLQMGGEDADDITNQSMLNLYKAIRHNCEGKPFCTGTIPQFGDVKATFRKGSYSHQCGWNDIDYLSKVNIVMECVMAGSEVIPPTLPPYEFELPVEETTTEPTTTVPTTTTPTTTIKTTTVKPDVTSNPGNKTNTGKATDKKRSDMLIIFIVIGVVAGVAALVGVMVAVYHLCRKSRRNRLRVTSQTEYPLNDKEKGGLPIDDNQPPMYT